MLPGLHWLPLDQGCWGLMMTALFFLFGWTNADSALEIIVCYLALVVIALGILQVVFGICQSNVVRI